MRTYQLLLLGAGFTTRPAQADSEAQTKFDDCRAGGQQQDGTRLRRREYPDGRLLDHIRVSVGVGLRVEDLPQAELVPVPTGLEPAEAVSLILNYITAYQLMNRFAAVRAGQRVLVHGASGGVGTALLQLGRLAGLEMYGTCSSRGALAVSELGGIPIDYNHEDFAKEIQRITGEGVDAVFDPIGGAHLWQSRKALRRGGKVVGYGLITSLRGEGLTSGRPGRRNRFRGTARFGLYIACGWLLPGRKRLVPYSIQTLKRLKPELFRQDLIALLELLRQQKIKPLIAERLPLTEARHAHELLAKGGVIGKIVLMCDRAAL